MKVKKLLVIATVIASVFTFAGCQDKTANVSPLTRDNYNTGGNLTFEYDEIAKTAYFGGEGEVVQFYGEDIAKGWNDEGCRVGVMLALPKEVSEYKSGSATLNDNKLTPNDYIITSEGQQYAIFQPIVSAENRIVDLKITWQEGYTETTYKIIIKDDTIFMEK